MSPVHRPNWRHLGQKYLEYGSVPGKSQDKAVSAFLNLLTACRNIALIKEMRAKIVAPVDTMGCAQAQNKESDPKVRSIAVLFLTFVLLTLRN